MATLNVYGFGALGDLLDMSPFVSKLQAHLSLAEIDYVKKQGDVRKAPRGKLPYIRHDGQLVTDSQAVIAYLREAGLADLDGWLSPAQRADAFVLRSMLEADLYFTAAYFRWQHPMGWDAYSGQVSSLVRGSGVPGFLVGMIVKSIRKSTVEQLRQQGAGRRDAEELEAGAREVFGVLEQFASRSEGPWWFGDQRSSLDAVVHAFVGAVARSPLPSPLAYVLDELPNLSKLFEHIDAAVAAAPPGN